ncbi:EpsG family protein [Phocaeicola sp.]
MAEQYTPLINLRMALIACKWSCLAYFILFMAIVSSARLLGIGPDYTEYIDIFIYKGYVRPAIEPAYEVVRKINDMISPRSLFLIYMFSVLLSQLLKLKAFISLSQYPIRVFIYSLLALYLIHEYTQIRAAVSIGVFLIAIPDLIAGKSKKYIFKIFVASCFHYSAIIALLGLLYVRLFKRNIIYLILPFLGFILALSLGAIEELTQYIYLVQEFIGLNKSGNESDFIKPSNLKYLMSLLSLFVVYKMLPLDDYKNAILFRFYSFGLCCFYYILPAQLPVIAVRLAEFYTPTLFIVYTNCVFLIGNKCKRLLLLVAFDIFVLFYCYASLKTTVVL